MGAEDSKGDRSEKDSGVIMLTNLPYKNNLFQNDRGGLYEGVLRKTSLSIVSLDWRDNDIG